MNNVNEGLLAEKIARVRDTIRKYPKDGILVRDYPDRYKAVSPVFNTPLTDEQLREFEQAYQIQIPEEYRAFLTVIGDGELEESNLPLSRLAWTVPDFRQIQAMGHAGYTHPRYAWKNWSVDSNFLRQSFPFEEPWPKKPRDRGQYDKQSRKYAQLYFRSVFIQGSLMIWHGGCGYYTYLVVTGKERGNAWLDDRPNDNGLLPYQPDEKDPASRCGFLDWYVTWLKSGWI